MQIQYITANPNDAEGMREVLIQSVQWLCATDHQNKEPAIANWCKNKTIANITEWINNPANFTLLATAEDKIVGVGMIQNNKILLLYLLPDFINKGIGKMLLGQLERHAKQNHIQEVEVNSTITALDFYLSQGYKRLNRQVDKSVALKKVI